MAKITSLKINNVDYELSSNSALEITETTTMQEVYDAAMNGCSKLYSNSGAYSDILDFYPTNNQIHLTVGGNLGALRGHLLISMEDSPDSLLSSAMSKSSNNIYGWVSADRGSNSFVNVSGIDNVLNEDAIARVRVSSPEDNEDATTKLYVDTQIETLRNTVDQLTTQLTTLQNRFTPYEITNDTTYGELYDHLVETGYPIIYMNQLEVNGGQQIPPHGGYFNVISYKKYNTGGADFIQLMLITNDDIPHMTIYFATNPSTQKISDGIGIYDQLIIDL